MTEPTKDDALVANIKDAIEQHHRCLRDIHAVWGKYEALLSRLAERNIIRISKENASVKWKNGALHNLNAGFDIQIEVGIDDARALAYQILKETDGKR